MAISDIKEGIFKKIHPTILFPPFILAINMNITAGNAVIAANIDNFSI